MHEIICITRSGFNFLHGEGVDLAAKVTYHCYTPTGNGSGGRHVATLQEMFIPTCPPAWDTL